MNQRNPYKTRRGLNILLPLPHTEHRRKSFLIRSINEWNCRQESVRSSQSLGVLKPRFKHRSTPNFYYSVETSKMASSTSPDCVENHNFSRQISDHNSCSCGPTPESVDHYLIRCSNYDRPRRNPDPSRSLEYQNSQPMINTV